MKVHKISIIIPVYNAEKYLKRCIDSVLLQSFSHWEIILVDDGSQDRSLFICQDYANKDNRIKVFSQSNAGPSVARNKGIELASGVYISFIDADDWIEPSFLETYVDVIGNYDIAFMGFTREDENGNTLTSYADDINTKKLSISDFLCKLYLENVFGWTWCKMFRLNIIEKHGIRFNETMRRREDALFTIDYLKHCSSAIMINSNKYHYFEHSGSLIREDSNPIATLEQKGVIKDAIASIANEELNQKLLAEYLHDYKFTMLMALMNKPRYECDTEKKNNLLEGYYNLIRLYPVIRQVNTTKNKINYYIMECILQTRCISLIMNLLPKL